MAILPSTQGHPLTEPCRNRGRVAESASKRSIGLSGRLADRRKGPHRSWLLVRRCRQRWGYKVRLGVPHAGKARPMQTTSRSRGQYFLRPCATMTRVLLHSSRCRHLANADPRSRCLRRAPDCPGSRALPRTCAVTFRGGAAESGQSRSARVRANSSRSRCQALCRLGKLDGVAREATRTTCRYSRFASSSWPSAS
jgi:hypothetical protein